MSRTNMPVSVIIYYHSFFFENMQESFELFNQKGNMSCLQHELSSNTCNYIARFTDLTYN